MRSITTLLLSLIFGLPSWAHGKNTQCQWKAQASALNGITWSEHFHSPCENESQLQQIAAQKCLNFHRPHKTLSEEDKLDLVDTCANIKLEASPQGS